MNPNMLKRLFVNASASTLAANQADFGTGQPESGQTGSGNPPNRPTAQRSIGQESPEAAPGAPIPPKRATGITAPRRSLEMNKTEIEYWRMLKAQYPQSIIRWEAYTLRLADRCRYSPDFSVAHPDGKLDLHEVKGSFIWPKALVKPRLAAIQFPRHRFFLAQKLKSGWEVTELKST